MEAESSGGLGNENGKDLIENSVDHCREFIVEFLTLRVKEFRHVVGVAHVSHNVFGDNTQQAFAAVLVQQTSIDFTHL
jgi:hypothetical protein